MCYQAGLRLERTSSVETSSSVGVSIASSISAGTSAVSAVGSTMSAVKLLFHPLCLLFAFLRF